MTELAAAAPLIPAAVIFDLGGVLIDWDPRHLYRRLIPDAAAMERFLAEVCTPAWNHAQDCGRPWADAVALLVAEHPGQADLIRAYDERWEETVGGALEGTVTILAELRDGGVPVYALTNWSGDKFRLARPRFAFLEWFRGIVVSGDERLAKPDPAFFRLILDRYALDATRVVYIDDMALNVEVATSVGMRAIEFRDADALRVALAGLGLPVAPTASAAVSPG